MINLLTSYPEAVSTLRSVEGDGWYYLNVEMATEEDEHGIPAILQQLTLYEPTEWPIPIGVIYGSGGYNRYHVYSDGRVVFSATHSMSQSHTERARANGFDIH